MAQDGTATARKIDNARKANILAMCAAAFPGVKFSVSVRRGWGADFDLSQLEKSGVFYLSPNGEGATQDNNNVPFDSKWWYVLNLYTDPSNSFQIAIPDSADIIYMRTKTGSYWNQWNEIGG